MIRRMIPRAHALGMDGFAWPYFPQPTDMLFPHLHCDCQSKSSTPQSRKAPGTYRSGSCWGLPRASNVAVTPSHSPAIQWRGDLYQYTRESRGMGEMSSLPDALSANSLHRGCDDADSTSDRSLNLPCPLERHGTLWTCTCMSAPFYPRQ
jgi:hypothetical protein